MTSSAPSSSRRSPARFPTLTFGSGVSFRGSRARSRWITSGRSTRSASESDLAASTFPLRRGCATCSTRYSSNDADTSEISLPLLLLHRRLFVVVDHPALPLAIARDEHLLDNLRERRRVALDRAGQRVAAERAEADALHLRFLTGVQAHPLVIDHQHRPVAVDHRALGGKIEGDDRDLFEVDVLP